MAIIYGILTTCQIVLPNLIMTSPLSNWDITADWDILPVNFLDACTFCPFECSWSQGLLWSMKCEQRWLCGIGEPPGWDLPCSFPFVLLESSSCWLLCPSQPMTDMEHEWPLCVKSLRFGGVSYLRMLTDTVGALTGQEWLAKAQRRAHPRRWL
jgi:hypothetical protein